MMKNKKIVYVLTPVTLLVWGLIFYKIIAGVYGNGDASAPVDNGFIPGASSEIVNDTFSIRPDYRDPFLGKFIKAAVTAGHEAPVVPAKKTITVPVVSAWPVMTYGGLIRNQKSNKQLVMLTVNGQSAVIQLGDMVSGVELTKIYKDSIEVKFGKEKRFLKK